MNKTTVSAPTREELQSQSRRKTETIQLSGAENNKDLRQQKNRAVQKDGGSFFARSPLAPLGENARVEQRTG